MLIPVTLPDDKNFRFIKIENNRRRQIKCGSNYLTELSLKGLRTLWEKEEILVTSIFSFFQNVFKSLPFFSTEYPLYIIPRRQNFTIIPNEKHLDDETKFLTNDGSYIS